MKLFSFEHCFHFLININFTLESWIKITFEQNIMNNDLILIIILHTKNINFLNSQLKDWRNGKQDDSIFLRKIFLTHNVYIKFVIVGNYSYNLFESQNITIFFTSYINNFITHQNNVHLLFHISGYGQVSQVETFRYCQYICVWHTSCSIVEVNKELPNKVENKDRK